MILLTSLLGAIIALTPAPHAGERVPERGPCLGSAPDVGAVIRGPVLHVLDGSRLCVALGTAPDRWAPVQLVEDSDQSIGAAERRDRGTLMAAAFAQDLTCEVVGISAGQAIARCALDDRPLSEALAHPEVIKAGLRWR